MLIDTHVHLDAAEFDADRPAVIAAARKAGVAGFVVPAVARSNFAAVLALAAANQDIYPALGIHPLYVDGVAEGDLAQLDYLLATAPVVAVGEIGLDHFVAGLDRAAQQALFVAQLELACKHRLPVILHVRRAVDAVIACLRRTRPEAGGIAHAFNGSRQQAEQLIGLGFKLGFGGTLSDPGSRRIRELAASLPLESMVLETDAPDMAPLWARGERNEPANIASYASILAGLRNTDVASVIRVTGDNARAVLRLPQQQG
ncbi:MAG: TatD family hydrolase [Thauera sp.]|nr:TatD family hydrolase [Thauera sp.]